MPKKTPNSRASSASSSKPSGRKGHGQLPIRAFVTPEQIREFRGTKAVEIEYTASRLASLLEQNTALDRIVQEKNQLREHLAELAYHGRLTETDRKIVKMLNDAVRANNFTAIKDIVNRHTCHWKAYPKT